MFSGSHSEAAWRLWMSHTHYKCLSLTTDIELPSADKMNSHTNQARPAYLDREIQGGLQQEATKPLQSQQSPPGSKQGSRLAKQWKVSHIAATIFCFSSFIVSTRAFWKSGHRNCDNESPYEQAYRSGLYSGVTCIFAYAVAHGTWFDSRILHTKASLTKEAKQRRMARMPIVVQMAAFSQVIAAVMNAVAVYRTSSVLEESRIVPVVATIAAYVCF